MGNLVVEFNGLPGCGKTTVSCALIEALRSNGITAFPLFRISLISKLCGVFRKDSISLLLRLLKYIGSVGVTPTRLRYVYSILLLSITYDKFIKESSNEVLVVDQGILQYLQSIAHNVPIQKKDLIVQVGAVLNDKHFNILRVDCHLPISLVEERIKMRGKDSRTDCLESGRLDSILHIQEQNFEKLRRYVFTSHSFSIQTERLPKENAEVICNNCQLFK